MRATEILRTSDNGAKEPISEAPVHARQRTVTPEPKNPERTRAKPLQLVSHEVPKQRVVDCRRSKQHLCKAGLTSQPKRAAFSFSRLLYDAIGCVPKSFLNHNRTKPNSLFKPLPRRDGNGCASHISQSVIQIPRN